MLWGVVLLVCALNGYAAADSADLEDDVVSMLQIQPKQVLKELSQSREAHVVAGQAHAVEVKSPAGNTASNAPSSGSAKEAGQRAMPSEKRQKQPVQLEARRDVPVGSMIQKARQHAAMEVDETDRSQSATNLIFVILGITILIFVCLSGWFLTHGGSWREYKANPAKAISTAGKDVIRTGKENAKEFDHKMDQQFPDKHPHDRESGMFRNDNQKARSGGFDVHSLNCCGVGGHGDQRGNPQDEYLKRGSPQDYASPNAMPQQNSRNPVGLHCC